MNTSVKLIKKDIDLSRISDEKQDKSIEVLVAEQNKIKMIQNGHEIRLETVEERLKTKTPSAVVTQGP